VRGIVINYHDITERVQAEREIQQRNEDLLIINTLNEAANRGEDIESIVEAFAREARNAFACNDAAIYLLTPDEKYIEMQNSTLSRRATVRIEKLIGRSIPKIQIPVREGGYFKRTMASEQGILTSDPKEIQQWIEEFTETTFLPTLVRPVIRKIVPQIFKTLNIGSTISIPLISSGRTIGILDMSSEGQFTEEDLQRIRSISRQVTAVMMRKQAEKQVQLQLKRLSALSEIDRAITSSLDIRLSLDVLLSEVLSQLGVDAAAVLLLNESNLTLEFCAGKGFRSPAVRQSRMRLGEGFAGQVGLERKLLHVPNLDEANSHFARAALLKDEDFVEYFGVPLIAKGLLKGVLEIFHRAPINPDLEWTNYLETLGGQAAIAIDNAQLFEGMQKSNLELIAAYDATIAGWSHAMDLRDKETEGHSQRVTELTLQLADIMGFSEQEKVHIRRGALLHDIGKLGVPDHILLKAGKLTEDEWASMRRHPTSAFEMLSPISYLRLALDIPYCHHEKWDGTGYPRGLKGEQIPLAARIFAVADVWDALTSDRPYRPAWTEEKTLEYIREQSGQHFDPNVVAVFLNRFSMV
jgi:HD-GYP domain-containing protein (c-di-GMP phosphodiesterase class II)